jgi:signal peptidase I
MGWGTGFFVAPGLILTCAHVVQEAKGESVQVRWQKQENWAQAVVEKSLPEPYDLALLRVTLPIDANPPCVYLDGAIQSRDPLYLFGYPDQDFPNGCPVTVDCEGLTGDEPALIKFALGQVRPGMSGSPLLNQRTGKVCGIVKFTRDRSSDLGGGAVSTTAILAQFLEVQSKNYQFHKQNVTWSSLLPKPVLLNWRERQDYQNRQILLNKVRNAWIKGVLENSLYSKAPIELGLEERFDILELAHETPEVPTQRLKKDTRVINQFDKLGAGRTLVLLGVPGSGKTTTLLELARDLIARAEQDVSLPIPVVFNLSSWANPKQKIQNWLVRELSTKYQVSRALGKAWIREQQILLLLDGLDEVREDLRGFCIQAINRFYREFGQTEIVVCSRLKDYENLQERFHFQEAIILQPLTQEQVNDYLNRAGEKLAGVRIAWQIDPVMQELAQTPLMLSVMALVYEGVPAQELPQMSLDEWQNHLWDKYIDRMFERRRGDQRYSKEQTIAWLSFLAEKMAQESQKLFLIEDIQSTWLRSRTQRWIYRLGVGLTSGLIIEVVFGLTIGLIVGSLSAEMLVGLISGTVLGLWKKFEQKLLAIISGAILGSTIGLVGQPAGLPVAGPLLGLLYGAISGGLIALLSKLFPSRRIQKTTRFNQAVWKSLINSLRITWIVLCLIIIPMLLLVNAPIRPPLAALIGLIGLLAGGLFCIQHLILRILLWWHGHTPWNYARFLQYSEEKALLQRVGGSYQFIHSLLQQKLRVSDLNKEDSFVPSLWLKSTLIAIVLISLLLAGSLPLLIDTGRIRSEIAASMSPRLQSEDRVIINKIFYHFHKPETGDIISYKSTKTLQKEGFDLKQIIALPGQSLEISNGKIYVNSKFIVKSEITSRSSIYKSQKIQSDSYLISANRQNASSKIPVSGIIHRNDIIGRVTFRYWPPNRVGKIY